MSLTPEQLAAANKAQLEALLALTRQAFQGVEALVELNMRAARDTLEGGVEQARALLEARDPQQLLQLQAGLVEPARDQVLAYGRKLADLAAATQSEVSRLAHARLSEAQEQLQALMTELAQNAPVGSEDAMQLLRTALDNASKTFQSVQQAAQQAASSAETSYRSLIANAEALAGSVTGSAAGGNPTGAGGRAPRAKRGGFSAG